MDTTDLTHLLLTFAGFFLAGLAVNLTPCVYPMLTVTAAIFKARPSGGQPQRSSFAKAFAYFLGIVVMYSVLGYGAASTGKLFGSALQNRWVLLGVAGMMLTLALSMFGLFSLRVPASWLNFLGGYRKANYAGLFASGMLVGVFAAPCIGPPVVALLTAVADNGDPRFGFSAFFVFALGLGLPYLLLGTFSGLVTRLPKAGAWLTWVERVFGIILLGFGIFYMTLAFHGRVPVAPSGNTFWTPYSETGEQSAMASHKPYIVDFFAEWCPGCHELDRTVFSDPAILKRLSRVGRLRVDATNIDVPAVQKALDRYSIVGLPTVVFVDGNGREVKNARVEGAASVKEFSKSLDAFEHAAGLP